MLHSYAAVGSSISNSSLISNVFFQARPFLRFEFNLMAVRFFILYLHIIRFTFSVFAFITFNYPDDIEVKELDFFCI